MYKYVLTHQPNLVSLYALGQWVICMLLANSFPRGRLLVVVWRHILGLSRATDRDPTSRSHPHEAFGSPPDLAPNSSPKLALGSPRALGLGSPLEQASVSLLEPASGSSPAGAAGICHLASHYKIHMARVQTRGTVRSGKEAQGYWSLADPIGPKVEPYDPKQWSLAVRALAA
jgi:hypothetical protein